MAPLLDFLNTPFLGTAAWFWLLFLAIVILLLFLDLGVLQRDHHEIGVRESLLLSAGYFSCGLAFGGFVWYEFGATSAMEYYTGFLVEQSLSMDNVFVMAMIFGFFGIPRRYQHRVLFWGILGVIVLRAIMIGLGTALGDWAADDGGLGYLGGAALFGGSLLVLVVWWRLTSTNRVLLFWAAFILTRPLGATVGDFLDKPLSSGGLDLSRPLASLVLALAILFFVAILPQTVGMHPRNKLPVVSGS